MNEIYINLKRFDVPKGLGGLCPMDDPVAWIDGVMRQSVKAGMGDNPELRVVYLLPESLIPAAKGALDSYPEQRTEGISVGCQGVHWDDVAPGGNFGAYTTVLPAAAAKTLGSTWAIIGHSEERRFKKQVIQAYDLAAASDEELQIKAAQAVDRLVHAEVGNALRMGLNVLLCVGESAEERGDGSFEEQKPRIEAVLREQLLVALKDLGSIIGSCRVVVGYEPIWAIGPGKTPPGETYIRFVSGFIKAVVQENHSYDPVVVYGGGLKEENAAMIASIESIGGGLVALTRFTGDIGFDVQGLRGIVDKYINVS